MLSFNFSKIYFKIYAIVQLFQKGLLQELISNRFLKKIDWSQSYRSEPFRHCSTHRHCSHICSSSIDSTFLVSGLSVFIDMKTQNTAIKKSMTNKNAINQHILRELKLDLTIMVFSEPTFSSVVWNSFLFSFGDIFNFLFSNF